MIKRKHGMLISGYRQQQGKREMRGTGVRAHLHRESALKEPACRLIEQMKTSLFSNLGAL